MLSLKTASLFLIILYQLTPSSKAACSSSSSNTGSISPTTTAATTTSTPAPTSTMNVQVGQNGANFSPSLMTASQGSTINFHFYPSNHSVAESRFGSPCEYAGGGIWSGYVPVDSGVDTNMFSVTINDSNAHWLYSSQGTECQSGMVMVINPPANSPDTFRAYQIAAQNMTTNSTDGGGVVNGGLMVANSESASASTTASVSASGGPSSTSTTPSPSPSTTATSNGTRLILTAGNGPSVWFQVVVGILVGVCITYSNIVI